jgi:hypothetical protein
MTRCPERQGTHIGGAVDDGPVELLVSTLPALMSGLVGSYAGYRLSRGTAKDVHNGRSAVKHRPSWALSCGTCGP